jgi:ABC-type transporter Mla subunit MlaD
MDNRSRTQPIAEPFVRRHRPFFVGLFVLIPALAVPAFLIFTVVRSDILQKWHTLHIVCDNSQGLKKGNQVSMSGTAIGHVKEVDLVREQQVIVSFDINSRYRRLVKKDTRARLKQRGFVGDWEIELSGGTPVSSEAEAGDTLRFEKAASVEGLIEIAVGIIDTATALLNDVAAIVKGIKGGEGTVGQLFNNDTLFRHISRIGANASAITSDVGKLAADARGTVRNADSLLSTLTGLGKSGAMAVDTLTILVNAANRTIAEVGDILKNLKTASDAAPELMLRLQRDLDEAEHMMRSLQEGWIFKAVGGPTPKNPHLADTP